MDVKTIREKLAAVLKEQENDTKYRVFIDDYTMLLDEVKVNTDTAKNDTPNESENNIEE